MAEMTPENGNGWWPTIGPDGRIACGNEQVYVGRPGAWEFIGNGGGPQWLGADVIAYGDGDATVLYDLTRKAEVGRLEGYNSRVSSLSGRWFGSRNTGTKEYHGLTLVKDWGHDIFPLALSPDGTRFAYVDHPQADIKTLYINGVPVETGAIMAASLGNTDSVWLVATSTYGREVHGKRGGGPIENWSVLSWEGPLLVETPDGPWIYSTTQTGFILRPAGESMGYRVDDDFYAPAPAWADGRFRLLSSSAQGVLQEMWINPADQRVSLDVPIEPPVEPPVAVPPVEPPAPEPPRIVVSSFSDAIPASGQARIDYLVSGHAGQRLEVWLLVDGRRVVGRDTSFGRLSLRLDEPGDYRLSLQLVINGRIVDETGQPRIVRVHPAEPYQVPTVAEGTAEGASKPWQQAADKAGGAT